MTVKDTGPLDWRIGIVDKSGRPTPEFQRRWAQQRANNDSITSISFGTGAPPAVPAPVDGAEYIDTSTTPYSFYVANSGTWNLINVLPGNPTAIAKDTAVSGTASTYMRSDAAPAVQKASSTLFGIVKTDNLTITASGGVISGPGAVVGFILNTGATGTNVGPELITSRVGVFNKCVVVTKTSDPSVSLTFRINKNGTNIFSSSPSIVGGTSPGTISTFTALTSLPFSFAAGDVFTIDVTSGAATWAATVQLEQ